MFICFKLPFLGLCAIFKKDTCPFSCLIHTLAGLNPGCQDMPEFIVLGKIRGKLLEPTQPVFRPKKFVDEVYKVPIYKWE